MIPYITLGVKGDKYGSFSYIDLKDLKLERGKWAVNPTALQKVNYVDLST